MLHRVRIPPLPPLKRPVKSGLFAFFREPFTTVFTTVFVKYRPDIHNFFSFFHKIVEDLRRSGLNIIQNMLIAMSDVCVGVAEE